MCAGSLSNLRLLGHMPQFKDNLSQLAIRVDTPVTETATNNVHWQFRHSAIIESRFVLPGYRAPAMKSATRSATSD
jgi:hypothetical protein